MSAMRRQAALDRSDRGYDPHAAWQIDRKYLMRATAIYPAKGTIDAVDVNTGHPLYGVIVTQPRRCNARNAREEMPEKGDIGLVEFAGGTRFQPMWTAWVPPVDANTATGITGNYRALINGGSPNGGVEIVVDVNGALTIRTGIDPQKQTQNTSVGVTFQIAQDGTVFITPPSGKTAQVGGTHALMTDSFGAAIDARLDAMDSNISTAMSAIWGGGAVGGTAYTASAAAARTSYVTAKGQLPLTKVLEGG